MSELKMRRRSSGQIAINQPTVTYNALSLIFAINTLLSWIECTFSSPMHRDYFKYLAFTSHLPAKWLLIIAVVISIVIIFLHCRDIFSNAYLNYAMLLLDIWLITYYFSPKFIATNKLVLLNAMITLTLFALALSAAMAKNNYVELKTYIILGVVGAVLTTILAYLMYVKVGMTIVSILLTFAIVLLAYAVQKPLCHYLQDDLANNLDAIFKLPQFLVQALRTR